MLQHERVVCRQSTAVPSPVAALLRAGVRRRLLPLHRLHVRQSGVFASVQASLHRIARPLLLPAPLQAQRQTRRVTLVQEQRRAVTACQELEAMTVPVVSMAAREAAAPEASPWQVERIEE